ncbi:DUF2909 domain-containing protein [Piscinibacter sakaiensis]|uniref:Transmembrane protein n=1 Tax=Piscinibacter sakaiensis TaxID=1547922 RepID=A0A0K8P1B0_PISS1|nr:DUF2909 domain-containing protein [Piscinibacter sakaiensis]GAP36324.1 hypothetical protein ISF6_2164 [Piscinibacter sakaiensis]
MKIVIAVAFVVIIGALLFAGVAMVRDGRDGKPKTPTMMRALALRVGVSVCLFLLLLLAYRLGWIQPTGLPRGA